MRLFEAIFIVFNVMLLIGLLLGTKKSRPMLWAAVTVSGALFVIHWLLEGLRWPLIPAYVLIVSPLIVLLWRRITGARKAGGFQGSSEATKPRLLFRVVVWLGVVCYGGISVAMPLLFPIFTFDKPEGAYGIGTDSDSFCGCAVCTYDYGHDVQQQLGFRGELRGRWMGERDYFSARGI